MVNNVTQAEHDAYKEETGQELAELRGLLTGMKEQQAEEIAAVKAAHEEAAMAGHLATHPAKKLQETIENPKMKKRMDFIARIIACIDLLCVKFSMVDDKPPGTVALLAESALLIREGSIQVQGAYLGASAAPGNRGWELAEVYGVEMEPFIRTPKGEKMGDMNLLLSYPEARKNALQIVKDAEKEGGYKKPAAGVGSTSGSGPSFGGGGGRGAGLGYRPAFNQNRTQQSNPNSSGGGQGNYNGGGANQNSNGKRVFNSQPGRGGY